MRLGCSILVLVLGSSHLLADPIVPAAAQLAQPESEKIILDLWDAAYLKNGKAGYVHTVTHEIVHNGQKLLRTTDELRLTLKRNADVIQLRMDNGTFETAEGKVVGVFMRQYLGKNKNLEIVGEVVGEELRLTMDQTKPLKPAPWNDRVVGLYRQQRMFKDKQIKPGDKFTFLTFEPTVNVVLPTHVRAFDFEEIELFAGQQKSKLLRVEVRTDKIEKVQLPTLTFWLAEDRTVVRSQVEVPGLGLIVRYRTSEAIAKAPGESATLTDIGLSQSVKLAKPIVNPYATKSAVYRISIRGDDDPGSAFSLDERQTIKNVKGNTLELDVKAGPSVLEAKPGPVKKVGDEFTQSSYFITSGDALVKKHAQAAVGSETDSGKKALLIEKWVYDHMTVKNYEALATADHVARTLEGDCTEFAMLMAAMCRAAGVPSRTAVGLVYADLKTGPTFAFHMWTEVFVRGRWIPLDATLGQGKVGATHLKISDQSWHDTRTMTPLFPVVRVLGRVSIEVVSVENVLKP